MFINAFLPVGRVNPFEREMYPGNGENPITFTKLVITFEGIVQIWLTIPRFHREKLLCSTD